jgi:hypothetical protein
MFMPKKDSFYASAVIGVNTKDVITKIGRASARAQLSIIDFRRGKKLSSTGKAIVHKSDDLNSINPLRKLLQVCPVEMPVILKSENHFFFCCTLFFNVLKIKM